MLKFKKQFRALACLALIALVLSGCEFKPFWKKTPAPGNTGGGSQTGSQTDAGQNKNLEQILAAQSKIKKFSSLAELKEFMAKGSSGSSYAGLGMMARGAAVQMMEDSVSSNLGLGSSGAAAPFGAPATKEAAPAMGLSGESGSGAGAADFSKTNIQVEGVDEADIVKTDGKYIYLVSKKDLIIAEASPPDSARITARVALDAQPQDLYVSGDKLAVFGQSEFPQPLAAEAKPMTGSSPATGVAAPSRLMPPIRNFSGSYFKVYDLADIKNPKLVRDLAFEGTYFDSRMIGDYVYFITTNYTYGYGDSPLPRIMSSGKLIEEPNLGIYYFDLPYQSYSFTRVSAINVKDNSEQERSQVYLLSGNQGLFVSAKNIYITYTKYVSEEQLVMEVTKEMMVPKLSAQDQEKIKKIEATEDYILNTDEKLAKITGLIERYVLGLPIEEQTNLSNELEKRIKQKYQDIAKELEKTVIHKIAVDKGELTYKTFGEVTGQVLNQFSMDEQDGYFRIATTKNRTWSRFAGESDNESYSNLYVLDENLKVIGTLENLAKGERIYSARFMGKRAYLVTFKQMDPLFAIDLSEPANPKVLGELKIPGFSNYLHPYDDTTLIGLGRDTDTNQWGGATTKGIKLSLFDVAQVDKPQELDTYVIGGQGSDSMALTDHHAFLFSKDKNLLVIPASIREGGNIYGWGRFTFSGALVFDLTGKKFSLKGRVDHSDGGSAGVSESWYGYDYYDNTVRRSLYISDALYTISSKYLKANKIEDLSAIKTINLSNLVSTGAEFDARRASDIKQIQTALELYFNDAGSYPAAVNSGQPIASGSIIYMAAVPANPGPGGEEYVYRAENNGASYSLTFALVEDSGSIKAGKHTATPEGIK